MASLIIAMCLARVLTFFLLPRTARTKWEQVQIGMNSDEVEKILGERFGEGEYVFTNEDGLLMINFDNEGIVQNRAWIPRQKSLWTKLQEWLRL